MSLYHRPWIRRIAALTLVLCAIVGLVRADPLNRPLWETVAEVGPLWLTCALAWWWVQRLGRQP